MSSELTDLKNLWFTLPEPERAFWRQQFLTPMATSEDLRNLIRGKLNIDLQHDSQLYEFRQWEIAQRDRTAQDDHLTRQENRLKQDHPDWDPTRLHEELLKQICLQTAFDPDDAIALKAVRAAARYSTLDLHRERFKESLRSKINAGIDQLAAEAKNNPTVKAAVSNGPAPPLLRPRRTA
jgi:hypothetical protein